MKTVQAKSQRTTTIAAAVITAAALLVPPAQARSIEPGARAPAKQDPEVLLIDIYKDLRASQLNDAQAKADALVQAYPNFRVGHLIRGDLLLMHTQPVTTLGAGVPSSADAARLKDLRDEARVRLQALTSRPDPEKAPRPVLQLRNDQKHVIVVDAAQSRLYVYQNLNTGLKFVTDFYFTQGKLGVHKLKEGDLKTPIGVYYITGRVSGRKLPDFYGVSALRINYPNEWDRAQGRGGSGIFLHGTPSDSYSRPPLDSDGCVVLTNADLKKLETAVDIGKTPVVIADKLEFIDKSKWGAERDSATKLIDTWRADISSMDHARVLKNYSPKFKSALGDDLKTWFDKDMRSLVDVVGLTVKLSDVTLFRYPGREDLLVSTFTMETLIGKNKSSIRKRQYWAREGNAWKIVFEGLI